MARGRLGAAGQPVPVRARLVRRRRRVRPPGEHAGRAARAQRHRRQRRLLLLHPAGRVPAGAQPARPHRDGRQRQVRRLAPGGGREAVRQRPEDRDGAQQAGRRGLHPGRRVPHRPLPRQGDGPEHPGPALRQQPVRAGVEFQVRRLGADHHGRGRRHRHPGGLLRRLRRGPRRAAEPPAPAARPGGHGGADELRPQRRTRREAQGPQGHQPARRHRQGLGPRAVSARLGRR